MVHPSERLLRKVATMTIFRAFNELDGFDRFSDFNFVEYSTQYTLPLAGIRRGGIHIRGGDTYADIIEDTQIVEGWLRCYSRFPSSFHNSTNLHDFSPLISLRDSTGAEIFGLWHRGEHATVNTGFLHVYWLGTADKSAYGGHEINVATAAWVTWDFNWKIHPTEGHLRIFANGNLVWSVDNVDTTPASGDIGISQIRFKNPNVAGNGSTHPSYVIFLTNVILADEPTFDMQVHTLEPTAEGTVNQWYGDVDKIIPPGYNATDNVFSQVAEQELRLTKRAMGPVPEGHAIRGLFLSAIMRADEGSEVKNAAGVVSVSGTSYETAPQPVAELHQRNNTLVFENNPATGTPWTPASLDAAEVGYKAKT